jgi:hypothetical protein
VIGEQSAHRRIFGAVDERAAFAAACHQAGLFDVVEMKRERGGGQAQALPDLPSRHSLWPASNEQPKHVETGFVRECRQGSESVSFVHISRIIDLMVTSRGSQLEHRCSRVAVRSRFADLINSTRRATDRGGEHAAGKAATEGAFDVASLSYACRAHSRACKIVGLCKFCGQGSALGRGTGPCRSWYCRWNSRRILAKDR